MSRLSTLRRQFGQYVQDADEFAELVADYDHLCELHASGALPALVLGLGLRADYEGGPLKPAIVLHVAAAGPAKTLPIRSKQGFPIYVEVSEPIVLRPAAEPEAGGPFQAGYSAPPGGVSIGIVGDGAGTLGCFATSQNQVYLISNRHVLDPTISGTTGLQVLQQSAPDGGSTSVATTRFLSAWSATSPNTADAGAALMADQASSGYNRQQLVGDNAFRSIVAPDTLATANETVMKSGRTTGLTQATVQLLGAQMSASAGGVTYTFVNCIQVKNVSGAFQKPGDSGALLVNSSYQPLGLMFSVDGDKAYAIPIDAAIAALNAAASVTDFAIAF